MTVVTHKQQGSQFVTDVKNACDSVTAHKNNNYIILIDYVHNKLCIL